MTLTSPTVYISVAIDYGYSHANSSTQLNTGVLVGFPASAISTKCGVHEFQPTTSVPAQLNYADLNSPYPWSAWTCANYPDCVAFAPTPFVPYCTISGPLNPELVPLPGLLAAVTRSLGTLWNSGCSFEGLIDGIWVSQIALLEGGCDPILIRQR